MFDQLFDRYRSIMNWPLVRRRQLMRDTVSRTGVPHLVASDGVVGAGTAFYAEVAARQLEGVMAKRLASRYRPGVRSDAWVKIKVTGAGT